MSKKALVFFLAAGLASAQASHAQAALVNLIGIGIRLGVNAATKPNATAPAAAPTHAPDRAQLVLQRTPAEKLPAKGGPQILALKAQFDRCHAALLADSTGVVCPPAQRAALQPALVGIVQAQPGWDLQPYQRETAFYLAEEAYRQQRTAPGK